MKTVFLFDIDGTLVNTGGAGGAALMQAFSSLFDVSQPGRVPFSGRTDRGIASDLFGLHDIDDSSENWQRLRDEYLRLLPLELPQRSGRVLDGVKELLAALADQADSAIGLLTGNVRDGARIKLSHFGIFDYFAFGGFGDVHPDRDSVAREALAATREHVNGESRVDVWVIGDTPLDISCARHIGARVLAVATGVHEKDELAAEQPDVLLDDLSDTARILKLLC